MGRDCDMHNAPTMVRQVCEWERRRRAMYLATVA